MGTQNNVSYQHKIKYLAFFNMVTILIISSFTKPASLASKVSSKYNLHSVLQTEVLIGYSCQKTVRFQLPPQLFGCKQLQGRAGISGKEQAGTLEIL